MSRAVNSFQDEMWAIRSLADHSPCIGTVSLSSGIPRTVSLKPTWAAARSASALALAPEVMGRIPPPVATRPAALPRRSDHDRLALLAEHAAQHVADLADGDVALHAL